MALNSLTFICTWLMHIVPLLQDKLIFSFRNMTAKNKNLLKPKMKIMNVQHFIYSKKLVKLIWGHHVLSLSCHDLNLCFLTRLLLLPLSDISPFRLCLTETAADVISHRSLSWSDILSHPANTASASSPYWPHSQTWSPQWPRCRMCPLWWSDSLAESVNNNRHTWPYYTQEK